MTSVASLAVADPLYNSAELKPREKLEIKVISSNYHRYGAQLRKIAMSRLNELMDGTLPTKYYVRKQEMLARDPLNARILQKMGGSAMSMIMYLRRAFDLLDEKTKEELTRYSLGKIDKSQVSVKGIEYLEQRYPPQSADQIR